MSKTKGTGVDPLELTQTIRHRRACATCSPAWPRPAPTSSSAKTASSAPAPSPTKSGTPRASSSSIWRKVEAQRRHPRRTRRSGNSRQSAVSQYTAKARSSHRWIFSRLAAVAAQVNDALEEFPLSRSLPHHLSIFLGRFLRLVHRMGQAAARRSRIAKSQSPHGATFSPLFDAALRLLHPVMPFLTEELWHRLPQPAGARSIALDKFPEPRAQWTDVGADDSMATLQEIIVSLRNIRAEMKVDPKEKSRRRVFVAWADAANCNPGKFGPASAPGLSLGIARLSGSSGSQRWNHSLDGRI